MVRANEIGNANRDGCMLIRAVGAACVAAAFVGGYLHNYRIPSAKIAGPTLPLAKAFAQVIQVRF